MTHLPSMTALRAFEAAARHLSIKKAAEELHLTPGAVSRQILALEEILGCDLFKRHHRQVELTAVGRAYLADIAGPLNALRQAGEKARQRSMKPVVSVLTYPTFALRWLMPRWALFLDEHRELDARLTTSLNTEEFLRSDADLVIMTINPAKLSDKFRYWKLFEVELFPVASPDLAARLKTPDDLRSMTLIHSTILANEWAHWLALAGVEGANISSPLQFESANVAIHAAMEGLGVAIVPGFLALSELESGQLVRPFGLSRISERPMHLIQKGPDTVGVRTVRDWLLQKADAFNQGHKAPRPATDAAG